MSLRVRLSVMMFFQFFVWGTWLITLGTYMLQNLKFSGPQVGMVYATNAIAATITPPLMGIVADKLMASNRLLVILHFLGGLCLLLAFSSTTFWWFYGSMLAYNLCYVPTFSLSNSLCFHHLDRPSQEFPAIRVWGTIAWVVTSVLLSWLALEDQATPLLIGGVVSIIYAVFNLGLPHTPPNPGFSLASLKGDDVQALLRDRSLIVLVISLTLICLPTAFYYSFLNPFLNEVGVVGAAAKMSIGQVVEVFVVLAMPWFFKKLRLRTIIFWGLAVWGLRYFVFAGARPGTPSVWLLYLAIAIQGIAFAWVTLAAQLYIDSRVPTFLRATAQGIIAFSSLGLGAFLGSWLAGEVVGRYTLATGHHAWDIIFLFPAVIGCIVAIGFGLFFPKYGSYKQK